MFLTSAVVAECCTAVRCRRFCRLVRYRFVDPDPYAGRDPDGDAKAPWAGSISLCTSVTTLFAASKIAARSWRRFATSPGNA